MQVPTSGSWPIRMRYKPSSVLSGRPGRANPTAKAIYLDPPLQTSSPDRSGSGLPATSLDPLMCRCLALHPVGFAVPADSRQPRCALTAPFHPYPSTSSGQALQQLPGVPATFASTGRPFAYASRGPSRACRGAVYFLWHCPDPGRRQPGRWALPTTAVQRCSDFPPLPRWTGAAIRASEALHYKPYRPNQPSQLTPYAARRD